MYANPDSHFSSQRSAATLSSGLLTTKRIKQWTFYRRDERRIEQVKKMFQEA